MGMEEVTVVDTVDSEEDWLVMVDTEVDTEG